MQVSLSGITVQDNPNVSGLINSETTMSGDLGLASATTTIALSGVISSTTQLSADLAPTLSLARRRRMINSSGIAQNGQVLCDFEDASAWTNYGSSASGHALSDNSDSFFEGSQSVTFSADGTGQIRYNFYRSEGVDMSGQDTFSLWLDWVKQSPSSNVTIYFSSDGNANFSNSVLLTLLGSATGSHRQDGGPYAISWNKEDMGVAGGSIDWSNVTNVNILVNCQAPNESVSFDALYVGKRTQPHVVMCFDDGVDTAEHPMYQKAIEAAGYGVPVTHYVIPSLVNGAGYLTTSELLTLQGTHDNCVATHSAPTGGNFASGNATLVEAYTTIQNDQSWIASQGFNGASHYAWAGGAYFNETLGVNYIDAAVAANMRTARSIEGVVQTNNSVESVQLGLIEPFAINSHALASGDANAAIAVIDRAIREGTTVFMYVHKVSVGSDVQPDTEMTGDDFTAVLQAIQSRASQGLITPTTVRDWYNKLEAVSVVGGGGESLGLGL